MVFLHVDTASSKMFELLLPLYTDDFKVILIDFLGNGKSDRVKEFPVDLWQIALTAERWQKIPGVGKNIEEDLLNIGVRTIEDCAVYFAEHEEHEAEN